MALDVKFEVFSYNLFYITWNRFETGKDFFKDFDQTCLPDGDTWNRTYYLPLNCLTTLATHIYERHIINTRSEFSSSVSDLSTYIVNTCYREDLFGNFAFFDRIFATIQFVVSLGVFCMQRNIYKLETLLRCAHISWAMYFDRFSEQFYEKGGWKQLKLTAASYILPCQLVNDLYMRYFTLPWTFEFHLLVKEFLDYYIEFEPEIKYSFKETFLTLYEKFLIRKGLDNINDAYGNEYIENFRCLGDLIIKLKCMCGYDQSHFPKSTSECGTKEQFYSVKETRLCRAASNVSQDAISMLGNPSTSTISSENLPHTDIDDADNLQQSDTTVLGSAETHHQESQDSCLSKLVHLSLDDSPKNSATNVISKKHRESSSLKDSNKMDAVRKKLFEEKKSNENVSSTSKDVSASRKAEELRKEKESADVQDLLRMLLVLGDREGIQHVRTTLQTSVIKATKQKIKRKKKN